MLQTNHPIHKHLTIKNSASPWDSLLAVGVLFYFAFKTPKTFKNPLKINSKMKDWVKGEADALITMSPKDFLTLTTRNENEYWRIMEDTRGLDFYNSDEIQDNMCVHPFLILDENGIITGHEGRHRAAATINNGEKKYEVGLILRGRWQGIPNRIIAEERGNDYFIAMPKPKWINKYTVNTGE
jgi:hypothetical protein